MAGTMLLCNEDYAGAITRDEKAGQIPSVMREVYEMMYVTEGSAEYWVEDQYYKLETGDLLLIPAGAMAGATLKKRGCPFERYGAWMTRRFMTFLKLQDNQADYAFERGKEQKRYLLRLPEELQPEVKGLFKTLSDGSCKDGFNNELANKSTYGALIAKINQIMHGRQAGVLHEGDEHRLSEVLAFIHDNCTEALSVNQLAEMFSYSSSHLAHSFKKQIGTSVYQYIILRRLEIGRQAMIDGIPVKQAYQRCGFGDYAGFYRAFTKEFGLSPQQYKNEYQ